MGLSTLHIVARLRRPSSGDCWVWVCTPGALSTRLVLEEVVIDLASGCATPQIAATKRQPKVSSFKGCNLSRGALLWRPALCSAGVGVRWSAVLLVVWRVSWALPPSRFLVRDFAVVFLRVGCSTQLHSICNSESQPSSLLDIPSRAKFSVRRLR